MATYTKDNIAYSIHQVRSDNPMMAIPDGATVPGYTLLIETPRPAALPGHVVEAGPIVNNAQTWVQRPVDERELSPRKDAIKAERDRRKFNGVFVAGKWIHTDTFSRTQWIAMVMMGGALPAIAWTTMDGTPITTTPSLAGQVFQAVATQDAQLFAISSAHIAAMQAAADPLGYDYSTGWPVTFGE